ncbi:glutathione S-transferase family protein [Roseateles koreensis]|uniref:Glutathione S-transferase family protein n=1 Tax=Roseateles koreensis TaxID=2987526 RepID=A0ABT5KQ75_9BURK|nr:glutathione S-transferase family protein [Roseateles koreensis]MDC8784615.1 glutathione S-transferase family protein [Roseateles koreensis]
MKLYIGNKNYSSWSMRPWVLLKAFNIAFEEVRLRFDFTPGSDFYKTLDAIGATGKVPVLVDDTGFAVWDTLAIVETLAERFPSHAIWPRDPQLRARARSVCAEMHSGFSALRNTCPMNIEADLSGLSAELLAKEPALGRDLQRLQTLWADALAISGGPFLFGQFSAADAFFAPVVMRLHGYGLPVTAQASAYARTLQTHPAVAAWVNEALAEQDFIELDEPYRKSR